MNCNLLLFEPFNKKNLLSILFFLAVGFLHGWGYTYTIDFNKGTLYSASISTMINKQKTTTICNSGSENIASYTSSYCYYSTTGCGIKIANNNKSGNITFTLSNSIQSAYVKEIIVYASKVSENTKSQLTIKPSGTVTSSTTFDNSALSNYAADKKESTNYKQTPIKVGGNITSLNFAAPKEGFVHLHRIDIITEETYTRTTTGGNLGSICIPYGAKVSECSGIDKVFRVSGVTTDQVTLESVSTMEAGVPYIFRSTKTDGEENTTIKISSSTESVETPNNSTQSYLVGNFEAMTGNNYVPADSYVLQDNQFKYVDTENSIRSGMNRCYLKAPTGSAKASILNVSYEDRSTTTAIMALNAVMDNKAKIYDLSGHRLSSLQKGINIVDGKKIILR